MIQTKEELVQFLKQHSLYRALSEPVLSAMVDASEEIRCGPGHIVFRQGDDADAIFMITVGSVEVIEDGSPPKVLAYLTAGDCFGETGIITDSKRETTVRVPEEAVLLRLSRRCLQDLEIVFPELRRQITDVVNRRLAGPVPVHAPGLQGNLAFFDLATVIQTVLSTRQNGWLKLSGRSGKLAANLGVRQGKIVHASYLHLTGDNALFELLSRVEPLDFIFEQRRDLDPGLPADKSIAEKEPYMLLMEGARRADELPKLLKAAEWPNSIPCPAVSDPDWDKLKGEQAIVARKIWLLAEAGLNVKDLSEKLPYDRYTVLSCLDQMCSCGLIKGRTVVAGQSKAPVSVAPVFAALNLIATNLAQILGQQAVRAALTGALEQTSRKYPMLSGLNVHPETSTLDLRLLSPEISGSGKAMESLQDLTVNFLALICQARAKM